MKQKPEVRSKPDSKSKGLPNNSTRGSHQSPPQDKPPRFAVEVVAKIAVELLAADKLLPTVTRAVDKDRPNYEHAAFSAIRLLETCDDMLKRHPERQRDVADWLQEQADFICRYPEGMRFGKAIIRITRTRSETEATPIFKRYLGQWVMPSIPANFGVPITCTMVEEKVEQLRDRGYDWMELLEEGRGFEEWKRATAQQKLHGSR